MAVIANEFLALGLSNYDCGLGGVYSENHAGISSKKAPGQKRRVG
jgi:hypothetical protein